MADAPDTEPKTYEDAIEQLERIIEQIESGEIGLEAAIQQYEAGTSLIKRCQGILDTAEKRIAELTADARGRLHAEGEAGDDFDDDTDADQDASF